MSESVEEGSLTRQQHKISKSSEPSKKKRRIVINDNSVGARQLAMAYGVTDEDSQKGSVNTKQNSSIGSLVEAENTPTRTANKIGDFAAGNEDKQDTLNTGKTDFDSADEANTPSLKRVEAPCGRKDEPGWGSAETLQGSEASFTEEVIARHGGVSFTAHEDVIATDTNNELLRYLDEQHTCTSDRIHPSALPIFFISGRHERK